jgi:hypothetical protein
MLTVAYNTDYALKLEDHAHDRLSDLYYVAGLLRLLNQSLYNVPVRCHTQCACLRSWIMQEIDHDVKQKMIQSSETYKQPLAHLST